MRIPLSIHSNVWSKSDSAYVCIIIPMSEIKKFVLIDFIASTVIYYALKIPSHSIVAAMVGSFAGPMLIRQTLKLNFGFSDGFRFLKRTHYSLASSRKGITSIGTWLQLRHSASKLPS